MRRLAFIAAESETRAAILRKRPRRAAETGGKAAGTETGTVYGKITGAIVYGRDRNGRFLRLYSPRHILRGTRWRRAESGAERHGRAFLRTGHGRRAESGTEAAGEAQARGSSARAETGGGTAHGESWRGSSAESGRDRHTGGTGRGRGGRQGERGTGGGTGRGRGGANVFQTGKRGKRYCKSWGACVRLRRAQGYANFWVEKFHFLPLEVAGGLEMRYNKGRRARRTEKGGGAGD